MKGMKELLIMISSSQWLKSYSPNKVKKAHYIMTYSVASFYTTPKNVMLFGFLVRRAFPTIYMYVMNDFEAIIFSAATIA